MKYEIFRKLKILLNKMSPKKFNKLRSMFTSLCSKFEEKIYFSENEKHTIFVHNIQQLMTKVYSMNSLQLLVAIIISKDFYMPTWQKDEFCSSLIVQKFMKTDSLQCSHISMMTLQSATWKNCLTTLTPLASKFLKPKLATHR